MINSARQAGAYEACLELVLSHLKHDRVNNAIEIIEFTLKTYSDTETEELGNGGEPILNINPEQEDR